MTPPASAFAPRPAQALAVAKGLAASSGPRLACLCRRSDGWRPTWRALHDDVTRFLNKSPENQAVGDTLKSRTGALLTPQLLCLLLYRVAHRLHVVGWPRLAGVVVRLNAQLHRVRLSADSCIGPGCLLPHPAGLLFVGHAGPQLTLYSMAVCGPDSADPLAPADLGPHLGQGVTVGVHAVLLGPLQVGDGSKIGPCQTLRKDLPPRVMVLGRPWRPRFRGRTPAASQDLTP
jgi:serine O-acetyltransferase